MKSRPLLILRFISRNHQMFILRYVLFSYFWSDAMASASFRLKCVHLCTQTSNTMQRNKGYFAHSNSYSNDIAGLLALIHYIFPDGLLHYCSFRKFLSPFFLWSVLLLFRTCFIPYCLINLKVVTPMEIGFRAERFRYKNPRVWFAFLNESCPRTVTYSSTLISKCLRKQGVNWDFSFALQRMLVSHFELICLSTLG